MFKICWRQKQTGTFKFPVWQLRSRFLITTIPSSMYAFDADGVNITLQSAAAIITESMNRLATDGVFVRDVDGGNVSWLPYRSG